MMPFRFGMDKAGAGLAVTRYIEKPAEREVIVPSDVAVIGNDAFRGCGRVERVILPASARRIMSCAFADCVDLREIDLGGTAEIGRGAFAGCMRLSELYLPDSVKAIRSEAFRGCTMLKKLRMPSKRPEDMSGLAYCSSFSALVINGQSFCVDPGQGTMPDTIGFIYDCLERKGYLLRRFYGTDIDTGFLYGFVMRLYGHGNEDAEAFAASRYREMIRYGAENGDMDIVRFILELYGGEAVTDELIDIAVKSGFHEIYLMLTACRHGEYTNGGGKRFML